MKNKKEELKVDFVIPWVDGNDQEWRKSLNLYLKQELSHDNEISYAEERYRDWGTLKYWFRGVEKNTPWVNRIHFITCGHIPAWLNTEHPKLHLVKHEDIIPRDYLPIFSSRPIDVSLGNIEGLSEHFVYFNDDMFVLSPVEKDMFFKKGLPCLELALTNMIPYHEHSYLCALLKDVMTINQHFKCSQVSRKFFGKFINLHYSFQTNKNNFLYLPWRRKIFPGFVIRHAPNPFLKSYYCKCFNSIQDEVVNVYKHRFRSFDDINQYVFLWWHLCEGKFVPIQDGALYEVVAMRKNMSIIQDKLSKDNLMNKPLICLNDSPMSNNEKYEKEEKLLQIFDKMLPQKSSYEK